MKEIWCWKSQEFIFTSWAIIIHRSEIRVSEICIEPNSYLAERQDPDQLSLFPVAGNVRMGNNGICLLILVKWGIDKNESFTGLKQPIWDCYHTVILSTDTKHIKKCQTISSPKLVTNDQLRGASSWISSVTQAWPIPYPLHSWWMQCVRYVSPLGYRGWPMDYI